MLTSLSAKTQRCVIAHFQQIVDANLRVPLPMEEISREIGVSSRTIRLACEGGMGVSPTQYILRRRMEYVRRGLTTGQFTRVTEAAAYYGFLELGRFSVCYRKLYGETPSTTIKNRRLITANLAVN